jgi:hypothetical protein
MEFCWCSGTGFGSVQWFAFFEFLTPFTLGGCTNLISNPFSTIVRVSDVPRGVVQVLLGHQKQHSPPLKSGLP